MLLGDKIMNYGVYELFLIYLKILLLSYVLFYWKVEDFIIKY